MIRRVVPVAYNRGPAKGPAAELRIGDKEILRKRSPPQQTTNFACKARVLIQEIRQPLDIAVGEEIPRSCDVRIA
jgi:hypothetical protein